MMSPQEQDYRIYLVTREPFDPRELPVPPKQNKPAWYIVQFAGPLTFEERNRLRAVYELRLRDYLPNFAYLEYLQPETWDKLSRDKLYRASLPYKPLDKISPGIADHTDADVGSDRRLRAVLFPEADLQGFLDALSVMFESAELRDRVRGDSDFIKPLDDRPAGDLKVVFPLVPREVLLNIARRDDVRWIEEAPELNLDCPALNEFTPAGLIQSGKPGITPVWDKGIQGEGQVIGLTDNSINISHCMFLDGAAAGPDHRKVRGQRQLKFDQHRLHGQTTAALAAGNDISGGQLTQSRGMALEAQLSLDDSDRLKAHVISLMEVLTNQSGDDAFIHSNSWHEGNGYTQMAADADAFVFEHEGHLICGSTGNSEEKEIGPPGSAKNALCVSANGNHPRELEFGDGSPGPISRADLRFKPDICAPGCRIASAGAKDCEPATLDCASSWATPIIAGAAALVRQYYLEGWCPSGAPREEDKLAQPSGALIKATLLNSTVGIVENNSYPSRKQGWGLVRLTSTLFFAEEGTPKLFIKDVPNAAGLHTGEAHTYNIAVRDDSRPLKVTLVWSDNPGLAVAARPLVNNLDLIVTAPEPDGKKFLGNHFDEGGLSVEGGEPDEINNVEMVIRNQNLQGVWTITVRCAAANGSTGTQGYALVVTAALG